MEEYFLRAPTQYGARLGLHVEKFTAYDVTRVYTACFGAAQKLSINEMSERHPVSCSAVRT